MKPSRDMVMCQVVLLMEVETTGMGRTHRPRGGGLRRRIALRIDGVPRAAELDDVVAEHLTPGVVYVEVECLPPVRDLPAAVAALDGAEQVPVDAAPGAGTAHGVEGRPGVGAGAVAAGLPARVAGEEIEGAVVAVEEDGPELGVPKRDARAARRRGGGRSAVFAARALRSAVFAGRLAVGPGLAFGSGRLAVGPGCFRARIAGGRSSFGSGFVVASAARDQGGAGDQCCEEARHVTEVQRVCHGPSTLLTVRYRSATAEEDGLPLDSTVRAPHVHSLLDPDLGPRQRRCFGRVALHPELLVGRLSPRQELFRPLSVSLAIPPEEHAGMVLLRVCEPGTSPHPFVHSQRLLEVSRRCVEAAQQAREDAERLTGGAERELGYRDCVERAVGQEEFVEGSGGPGGFEGW